MNKFTSTIILFSILTTFTFISCDKDDDCSETTWYNDSDNDGFGNPDEARQSCDQPEGYVSNGSDFDDTNSTAFPGAEEICGDGIDNDGNGTVDGCLINQISGNWISNFGDSFTITETEIRDITNSSNFLVEVVGGDHVICQNDLANNFNPGLYSKFVFTGISTDEFHYCQSYFDSPSQEFIENGGNIANPNDLTSGCGGFPWSTMTRQ